MNENVNNLTTDEEIFECPFCGTNNQNLNDKSFECISCKSYFRIESNNNIRLVKSGIAFNGFNFLLGLFYTLFILGFGYFCFLDKMTVLELGFAYLALVIMLTFRILFNQIWYDAENDSTLSIIIAIFNGRIKYYDTGSKLFAYSWGLTGILGIIIIMIGLFY